MSFVLLLVHQINAIILVGGRGSSQGVGQGGKVGGMMGGEGTPPIVCKNSVGNTGVACEASFKYLGHF